MKNKVELQGKIVLPKDKDLEVIMTKNNNCYVRFSLAVDRKDGKWTDYIKCIAWEENAHKIATANKPGDVIEIVGHIQTGSYTGKQGKVYTTDVCVDDVITDKKESVSPNTTSVQIDEEDLPFY